MRKREPVYETYEEHKKFNTTDDMEEEKEFEERTENYVSGLIFFILKIFLGMVIGVMISPGDYLGVLACVGILVGLTFFNKVVQFNLYGNSTLVIAFWLFKIFVSMVLGVIAMPIMLVWYITGITRERRI